MVMYRRYKQYAEVEEQSKNPSAKFKDTSAQTSNNEISSTNSDDSIIKKVNVKVRKGKTGSEQHKVVHGTYKIYRTSSQNQIRTDSSFTSDPKKGKVLATDSSSLHKDRRKVDNEEFDLRSNSDNDLDELQPQSGESKSHFARRYTLKILKVAYKIYQEEQQEDKDQPSSKQTKNNSLKVVDDQKGDADAVQTLIVPDVQITKTKESGSSGHWRKTIKKKAKPLLLLNTAHQFGRKGFMVKLQDRTLTLMDPSTQILVWRSPPKNIFILVEPLSKPKLMAFFDEVVRYLVQDMHLNVYVTAQCFEHQKKFITELLQARKSEEEGEILQYQPGMESDTKEDNSHAKIIDLVLTVGNSSTLVHASALFQRSVPPILAFSMKSFGFLSPFQPPNFKDAISDTLQGIMPLCLRTRLKCTICLPDSISCDVVKGVESVRHHHVLNEVVIDRGPNAYLCYLDLFVEGRLVTNVQGDGLIIATPTGSTAYSAAAGASMVHPSIPSIIITPICSHSLSFRPIVVPAGVEVSIQVSPAARTSAWVSFDGQTRAELVHGGVCVIGCSVFPVPSICARDQVKDWFRSLGSHMKWNTGEIGDPSHSEVSSNTTLEKNSETYSLYSDNPIIDNLVARLPSSFNQ